MNTVGIIHVNLQQCIAISLAVTVLLCRLFSTFCWYTKSLRDVKVLLLVNVELFQKETARKPRGHIGLDASGRLKKTQNSTLFEVK